MVSYPEWWAGKFVVWQVIGEFYLGIGVFQNYWLVILSPISDFEKHQSPIQNHQLLILSPIGDFYF